MFMCPEKEISERELASDLAVSINWILNKIVMALNHFMCLKSRLAKWQGMFPRQTEICVSRNIEGIVI